MLLAHLENGEYCLTRAVGKGRTLYYLRSLQRGNTLLLTQFAKGDLVLAAQFEKGRHCSTQAFEKREHCVNRAVRERRTPCCSV